ncbi:unnamed protein product [Arabidopsis halleri]
MVGIGLMQFPTCPKEAVFLQHVLSLLFSFFVNSNSYSLLRLN